MNYQKIYDSIIQKRLTSPAVGNIEKHHIIPRSLGGPDTQVNLVSLTYREHFICHLLLVNIHKNNKPHYFKMVNAAFLMSCSKNNTSRKYEKLKLQYSKIMSIIQTGSKNSQYGSKWYTNQDLRLNKKFNQDDEIPCGWISGRTLNWEFLDRTCSICGQHLGLTKRCRVVKCAACIEAINNKKNSKDREIRKIRKKTDACMKKCVAYGITYKSVKDAAIANNIGEETMRRRITSHVNKDCYYL